MLEFAGMKFLAVSHRNYETRNVALTLTLISIIISGAMLFYGWGLIILGGVIAYFSFDHTLESSLICFAPVILAPFVLMGEFEKEGIFRRWIY